MAVVVLLVGCGGSSGGDDTTNENPASDGGTHQPDDGGTNPPSDGGTNPPGDAGTKASLTVTWSIKNVEGTTVPCGTQYDKIKVHAQAYSAGSGIKTGDPFTKLFDCSAGTGTIELPTSGDADPGNGGFSATDISGRFDAWISQTEASGELARQVSRTTHQLDLSTGNKAFTATLYENGGYRLVSWSLLADSTGDPISCAASGVDTVELTSVNEATGVSTTNRFPCAGDPYVFATGYAAVGGAISSPLVAGRYTFTISAYSNNTKVGTSEPDTDEEVRSQSRINDVENNHFIRISTR